MASLITRGNRATRGKIALRSGAVVLSVALVGTLGAMTASANDGPNDGPQVSRDDAARGDAADSVQIASREAPGQAQLAFPYSDTQSCNGARATHVGSSGDDYIRGTSGDDVIVGRGGDDRIDGRGGDDLMCGGDGDDVMRGGRGDDELFGGGGRDRLDGGRGDDECDGGSGRDRERSC